jgi:hypothetical protein
VTNICSAVQSSEYQVDHLCRKIANVTLSILWGLYILCRSLWSAHYFGSRRLDIVIQIQLVGATGSIMYWRQRLTIVIQDSNETIVILLDGSPIDNLLLQSKAPGWDATV